MNEQPQESRARLWVAIGVVVAATVTAILLVPDDQRKPVEAIPTPPVQVQPETAESRKVETEPPESHQEKTAADAEAAAPSRPAEETSSAAAPGPEGSAARSWLAAAGQVTPGQLLEKARQFERSGQLADAWLLYFKAAREGSAAAAMALAEQADPVSFDPARSVFEEPDLVQAHKWYRRAAELGDAEAQQRLQRLLALVEKQAVAGDERAALLLQEWKAR